MKYFCLLFTLILLPFLASGDHLPSDQATIADTASYASIDKVLTDLYQSISFDTPEELDWELFRGLFAPEAKLIPVQASNMTIWTVEDYIARFQKQVNTGQLKRFRETEIGRTVDRFGDMIQVFSAYKTEFSTDEQENGQSRGINSIQMINKQGRWWIINIIWENERASNRIPEKYLDN